MSLDSIIEVAFMTIVMGGLGSLFWARLNRLETEIADIRKVMVTKEDLTEVKADIVGMHQELAGMRQELTVMRSDLTHVALAVGANRPKPAEG